MTSAGMPEQHDPAAGPGDAQAVGDDWRCCRRRRSWRGRRRLRWSPTTWQPATRRTARASSAGGDDVVGAELRWRAPAGAGSGRRRRCARRARSGARPAIAARPIVPAPSTATIGLGVPLTAATRRGQQGGVDAAGERLDEHGPLVGHVVGDRGGAGCRGRRTRRPAAAGRAAEPGLDARLEVARWRGGRSRRRRPARRRRTAGAKPRASWPSTGSRTTRVPSSSSPTTSWPGTNGKLTQSSKYVEAWPSTSTGRPQMPGEAGVHPLPARPRQLRRSSTAA